MAEQTKNEDTIQEEKKQEPGISFVSFLLKILAGGAGGIVGTLALIVIFLLAQSALSPLTSYETGEYISPIFIFILAVMIFISSTIGNLLSIFLLSLTERDKYQRTSSAIYQAFIISLIIFLLMIPVYFIAASIDISIIAYTVGLHIIISALTAALILEIVSNYKYALVGVYGVSFSIIISAGILFTLAKLIDSPTILLFAALPIVWGSLALLQGLVNMIYGFIARVYDKDFLSTQTLYGSDYGRDVEGEEEEQKNSHQDEAGADFLRKKN